MAVKLSLNLDTRTKSWLKKYPDTFKGAFRDALRKGMFEAERQAKRNFGGKGQLKIRTGHLRRSIRSDVEVKHGDLIGVLWSDVVYAGIHEFGGKIKAKASNPTGYLRFMGTNAYAGKWQRVKEVVMPRRPFLLPAITGNSLTKIQRIIVDDLVKQMNKPA